ncbi:MAG: response regulator [Planctomycetes bacterium]|nr:response regulator [Planctomycetota bacterium]
MSDAQEEKPIVKPVRKVLVVEDDPGIALVLRKFFEKRGVEVHQAGSGRAAFMKTSKGRRGTSTIIAPNYDLITMDMMMPNWDGVTAINAILRMCPDTIFIVISGVRDGRIKHQVSQIPNVKCWVEKPFTQERLAAIVDRLEKGESCEDLSDANR